MRNSKALIAAIGLVSLLASSTVAAQVGISAERRTERDGASPPMLLPQDVETYEMFVRDPARKAIASKGEAAARESAENPKSDGAEPRAEASREEEREAVAAPPVPAHTAPG